MQVLVSSDQLIATQLDVSYYKVDASYLLFCCDEHGHGFRA